ncbi:MAG TPA: hypothetical protein EYN96_03370 [Candidatus Hydrogenedentes bacterium]|nr:hypothetical protein [Candidatus Hydrogenedentota bacterium]
MKKELSRHDFLQSLGRKGMMLSLGIVGTAAVHGSKTVAECFNHNYCDSCFSFKGCTLPEKKEIDA